jgi:hypothetical protein
MNTEHLVPLGPNRTRDGRKARVICIDRQYPEERPVVALVWNARDQEEIYSFFANGRQRSSEESTTDLVGHLPPEPEKPIECWINVGPGGQLNRAHDSQSEAVAVCADNYRTAKFREVLPGADDELGNLRRWKDEAMQVLGGLDLQAIGKELQIPLGTDIGPQILPAIRKYRALLGRAAHESSLTLANDILDAIRP